MEGTPSGNILYVMRQWHLNEEQRVKVRTSDGLMELPSLKQLLLGINRYGKAQLSHGSVEDRSPPW